MEYEKLSLPGVVLFKPDRKKDERGYFSETFRQSVLNEAVGRDVSLVQDNQSYSKSIGTIRGLHYQTPPQAQGKLVQCSQGAITDVAVDARKGSPSFGQYEPVELNQENGHCLWLPEGFLHGFITREAGTVVQYKCTNYYDAKYDAAILWNDKVLDIDWELKGLKPIVSEKDARAQSFSAFASPFIYESPL